MPGAASVLYERRGPVGLITLNRPQRMNAMDQQMLIDLDAVLDQAEADPDTGAVVVTGAGKGFSSGFDLKAQAGNTPIGVEQWREPLRRDFDTVMRFWHLKKPTIAAVHGPALAGACELAMACDITIATAGATFGEPELKFGAGIVVMILPWIVGAKIAREIILTGEDALPAQRAYEIRMINRVVPEGTHVEEARAIGRRIAAFDRPLVSETKRALNRSYELMGMGQALEAALDIDLLIEGQGMESKRLFLEIVRRDGLRAAIAWRDQRMLARSTDGVNPTAAE
ncbi:MAG: enoyl-CoA hydratase/isomerase family protein [Burkholderiaceae bacterium]